MFLRMLTCTWREDARNLLWTEFEPAHGAEEALLRADYPGGDWSSNGHVAVCKPNPAAIAPHLERYAG